MTFEEWHAFIAAHLPEPVQVEHGADADTWFTGGDPGEVIVRLRARSIAVYEFTVGLEGRTVAVQPRLVGSLRPAGLDDSRAMEIVRALLAGARDLRQARFSSCRVCGQRQPPEWIADQVCQECAGGRLDLVH
jgi:hypothetical protein